MGSRALVDIAVYGYRGIIHRADMLLSNRQTLYDDFLLLTYFCYLKHEVAQE